MTLRVKYPRAAVVAACTVLACLIPVGVSAQNPGIQELLNRVDRLQRELTALQRHVYQDKTVPANPSQPSSAVPADPRMAARHSVRIAQLENEISRLTGRMEEIDFALNRIEARLDKLVVDLDQRLTALEGGGRRISDAETPLPVSVPPNESLNLRPLPERAPALTPPAASAVPVPAPARPVPSQPGVLGTIPKDLAVTKPRGPKTVSSAPPPARPADVPTASVALSAETPALPPGTPKSQYDYALSLMLGQQDFAAAERALKAFVEQHPQDDLAGNAQYWLGETYYVRRSYQNAAFAFAEGYQRYPKNRKAPDSLLKLGMSLSRMGKRKEACTAFSRFLSKYTRANDRLKARIDRERRQAKCR
ncbi:MAG TPA: tol-pal system protein YbgF [Rhodospirillaceae bacterium]|nr:tol-pal system protein YbgF [Rhodospirillaceae bacterium]